MSTTHAAPIPAALISPSLDRACVEDAMHPGVLSCPPQTPLRTVARMMANYRVHAIVVTELDPEGELDRPWGVVSDLDLTRAASGDVDGMTAAGVARTAPVTIAMSARLLRATELMVEHGVSHLIVTDPSGAAPIGVLSTHDVAAVMAFGGH